ncbi:MAG TPA: glycine dehydrogenase (aminomethyl-transferring), partial [Acidimicrobiales bacterium]|nr:glycine dehydrogenase (aminomethyl-transferring) [Acidimicrobiales bacterium]
MTDRDHYAAETFADRHIGPSPADVARMLDALDLRSLDELIDQAVPASIRDDKPLAIDDAMSEPEALVHVRALADRNEVLTSLIGQGYYGTHTPGVILRNVLENPAWYTAYTPYQPEISQGRLEALLNFQTMVCDLTGLEIANASMLDESTAAAEAMALCRRSTRHGGNVFFVDAECHPQTVAVVATRAEPLGIELVVGDPSTQLSPAHTFGVLLQHPGTSGVVRDLRPVIEAAQAAGGLAVVATDLLACTLLVPPGELGADVAVGSAQRFGVPMGFGGPHAGFLATRHAY